MPILAWTRRYQRSWLCGDVLAGLTVAAYLIPQVMANAELARLPAQVGLWAALGALFGYALIGGSRLLSMGPESTASLMTATTLGSVAAHDRPGTAIALGLLVALFCVLGWALRLAAVAELLSKPILVGYMAGIAGVMVVSQLDDLLGFPIHADGFVREFWYAMRHMGETHAPTAMLSLSLVAALLITSWLWPKAPVALAGMLAATAVSAALHLPDHGVETVGHIARGLPDLHLPALAAGEWWSLTGPALAIAFVTFTDTILTARAFADDDRPDAKQELLALGASNLGAAVMQGFPVSSSGSRTAIAHAVGGRSQLTGVVTLVATAAAVFFARPVLEAFPTAALAAVVVYAAVRLVDVPEMVRFWRFRHSEFVLVIATTISVLTIGVLEGILVAIGLSVLDLLRRVARPHHAVLGLVPGLAGMHDVDDYDDAEPIPGLIVFRYDSPLFFANAEDFRSRTHAALDDYPDAEWMVINMEAISRIDVTAADILEEVRLDLAEHGVEMGLARMKDDLRRRLQPTGFLDRIGADRIFPTLPTAVDAFRAWQQDHVH
ncbi:SulP family inorganic anion transporter [Nocardioides nematodiphilus]|uniref:SulP family inorganic anion transporter n=1 Tax=Nocardioides nematodiphilus TaxID=2849669 RepID=UPI001CD9B95F|nr:sulfate permease [Nocardioides nematodiphilus]MCA1983828.1 sulfate permease [Nocardioides nematodiphilus]